MMSIMLLRVVVVEPGGECVGEFVRGLEAGDEGI
jgi:hypothetical protein